MLGFENIELHNDTGSSGISDEPTLMPIFQGINAINNEELRDEF
jgi:hypothetical protein